MNDMVKNTLRCAIAVAALACSTAHAQIFRAYLASDGSDANPCTLPAPCRLLPAAIAAVASGGEVWMLDSANFNTGTVTVGKSVSILAVPGAVGSIVATGGGPAIAISASGLVVALRNVNIGPVAGGTAGTFGVHMTGASTLTIDHSVIANLASEGVRVAGTGRLYVVDSILRGNSGWAVNAQLGASVSISRTQMLDNWNGVLAYGFGNNTTTTVDVSDSVIAGGSAGVRAHTTVSTGVARISVIRSKIVHTTFAVRSATDGAGTGTAVVSVGSSLLANNVDVWGQFQVGSTLYTLGDNHVVNNTGIDSGNLTLLQSQ